MSEFESCHGLQPAGAPPSAAPRHRAFPLPGDTPVWGRDRPFKVDHLRLEFAFDLRAREVRGVATTTFHPRVGEIEAAVFDAVDLDVESVTDGEGKRLAFTLEDRGLRVDLGGPRGAGESLTVTVQYRCRPRRGLYFNAPEPAYPDRPTQIWTQGQPEDSAHYFPCLDFPGEKFTSEMLVTVPLGWTAVSNGRLEAVREDRRRNRATFHWTQEIPHPAYLITLTAGEFDAVEERAGDVPVEYYGAKGTAAGLRRAFGRTPDMVTFFSDAIGVPYPWAKYATIAVADFIFGGMENTSATTMTDTVLHDDRAHEDYLDAADSLSAHELAHQWFGDLLTCREWSHGWLNESFATYFEALYFEHSRGWDAFRYDVMEKAEEYLDEDGKHYRRPIVENVYRDPIEIFDRHLYERGAVVLDMLRYNLGDDLWWRAIHHYVEAHRERDVLTHDLQRAVEAATGRNMDWFFEQWVWKAGHPEFKASYEWDGDHRLATVHLAQTQQPDALTSIYRTPIEIAFMTANGFRRFTRQVTEASHSFVFELSDEPAFVSIDPAGRVLKTLDFAPGEKQLRERLAGDPEAIGRIDAAKGLAKVGTARAFEALRAALLNDREAPFVRAEIAKALGESKAAGALEALVEAAGVDPSRVRRAVATALGNFRDALLAGRGDRSYYAQAAAATALGKTLQPSAARRLHQVLGRPAHNDVITAGALAGLGALRDPAALPALLDHTRWGVHPNARRAATAALGDLAPHCEPADRLRARERLEELIEDAQLRVQFAAIGALTSLADPKSLAALQRLEERAQDARVRRQARVAMRDIRERSDRAEDVRALSTEVEKLRGENRQLKDRLTTIEARLDGAAPKAPARRRAKPAGKPASKRGARRGR